MTPKLESFFFLLVQTFHVHGRGGLIGSCLVDGFALIHSRVGQLQRGHPEGTAVVAEGYLIVWTAVDLLTIVVPGDGERWGS